MNALQISALWRDTVIDTVQVSDRRAITAGGRTEKGVDLHVDAELPSRVLTIASADAPEPVIVVPEGASWTRRRADGTIEADASAPGFYALRDGERFSVSIGAITFVAEYVPTNVEPMRAGQRDWIFQRVTAISGLLHLLFVVATFFAPRTSSAAALDVLYKSNRPMISVRLVEPAKKPQQPAVQGREKHRGPEGRAGSERRPQHEVARSRDERREEPTRRDRDRARDREIAKKSGILGMLGSSPGDHALSSILSTGGLGGGINIAAGGLEGARTGEAAGVGGVGTRGLGAGGGGDSQEIGGLGTHGRGDGDGDYGKVALRSHGHGGTRVVPGKTIFIGNVNKAEIGEVIRRNLPRFKHCYQKELNADPNLSGKVAVTFTIGASGRVQAVNVSESTIENANVETCVRTVMASLAFGKPKGGGIAVVTYPFLFATH